ncbi:MAG TPA: gamma-glutamyltransferase [Candidatus Acidoferrales bacterium]|nr:gamma-glutamyltransferase [Candidatus Acidoferrales bacterium]
MTKLIALFAILTLSSTAVAAQPQAPSRNKTQPREYTATAARETEPEWPARALREPKGMVVSDEKLASDAGVEIMKRGGNAVDAAVAVAFALAVVEPQAGNIGGGGFMLVRMANGREGFVDYRETAPAGASRNMYLRPDGTVDPKASIEGYRAIGVPGTVAGMALALHKYGTMTLGQVMQPAIRLAANGFPVSAGLAGLLRESQAMAKFPVSHRIFQRDGNYYATGDIFKQPELAATLQRIAKDGPAEFYRGRTAHDLAQDMKAGGGLITLADLEHYEPKIRHPLEKTYAADGHKWEVVTSPPPSSGGVVTIEALNILQTIPLKSWADPESVHWVVEAMRRAFADRAMYLADPDFEKLPVAQLTSECYADSLRATIDPAKASSSQDVAADDPGILKKASPSCAKASSASLVPPPDKDALAMALAETVEGHTTHFSVVDAAGNAVSNTYTINNYFGSGVTSTDGFLLNDEMDDFTSHPGSPNMFGLIQSENNAIAAGKRPLSSMMPTIVLRDGKLSFVTGSPGGPTIISATLLSVLNWMRLGMGAQAAINAPRFHEQWMPAAVVMEPTVPASVVQGLESRGYQIVPRRMWLGKVEAIGIDPANSERLGAPDPRRGGAAAGY